MLRAAAVLLALSVAAPVLANDGPCSERLPPAHYASMPVPFHELVTLASHDELRRICGGNPYFACVYPGETTIYMMSDHYIADAAGDYFKGRRWKDCLVAHELAHINGWSGDHPN